MDYQIVTLTSDDEGRLKFSLGKDKAINQFCQNKRDEKDSQCNQFYKQLFARYATTEREFTKCPYGLHCVGPIWWTESDRIASGLLIKDASCPPELSKILERPTKEEVIEYLRDFDNIVTELHQQSYNYLESAIHDVRHLNADITTHSERLLNDLGYAENQEWDKQRLNSQMADKRTLSIYCASRDISAALSMHEIAIDPRRASDDVSPTSIHKLFYRQKQINIEKLDKKNLTVQLDNTIISKNLTKSFSLVPIILLNNAIKYSDRNSTIHIQFIEAGNIFRIVCSNFGPVVRDDELDAVFLKNKRGSNRAGLQGHGIGLWLASIIVGANRGSIRMEVTERSTDYSGRKIGKTTLTIRLT